MSKPGNSPTDPDVHHLSNKPETEDYESRNRYNPDKDKGQDSGSRIEQKIRSEHAGNRPTRTDHRNLGRRMESNVDETRTQSGDEIKKDEPEGSEKVFNVIAKDPKIEHIAEKMENPSVNEQGCQESQRGRDSREKSDGGEMGDFIRNGSHSQNMIFQPLRRKNLIKKDQDVQSYENNRYDWKTLSRIFVLKRYKHTALN